MGMVIHIAMAGDDEEDVAASKIELDYQGMLEFREFLDAVANHQGYPEGISAVCANYLEYVDEVIQRDKESGEQVRSLH